MEKVDSKEIEKRIKEIIFQFLNPSKYKIFIFGSRLTNKARKFSDYDVGIISRKPVPGDVLVMIEGAERFGLAQLHQFRGRVGRDKWQSYCLLFTESPARKTQQRLKALITCEDGFALAEKDLEIRGPGDFAGTRQWGIPDLMTNSFRDVRLIEKTRESAKEILQEDPQLKKYPVLQEKLKKFREKIHME